MKYNLAEMMRGYLRRQFAEQRELFREMSAQVNVNSAVHAEFIKQVCTEALRYEYGPVQLMKLGLAYGLVLGVLMERERVDKRRLLQ